MPLAVLVMIGSGWEIYNASPLFAFVFPPSITLGGWLAGALLWHSSHVVLAVNGLLYLFWGSSREGSGEKLFPFSLPRLWPM